MKSLKRKADFERIKSDGRSIRISNWIIFKYIKNKNQFLRFGFSISKRVGKAHDRNQLKRWFREALRQTVRQDIKQDNGELKYTHDGRNEKAIVLESEFSFDLHIVVVPIKGFDIKMLTYDEIFKKFSKGMASIRRDIQKTS